MFFGVAFWRVVAETVCRPRACRQGGKAGKLGVEEVVVGKWTRKEYAVRGMMKKGV